MIQAGDADDFGVDIIGCGFVDAVALDGHVEAAVFVADVEGFGEVDGEVWAAHDADGGGAVFDESEGDGVLLVSEETFGAVDGVEGPEGVVVGVACTEVDGVEDFLFCGVFPYAFDGGDGGVEVEGVVFIAEEDGIFFSDEVEVFSEFLFEDHADDCLGGEVGDGDGGFIVFGHGADLVEVVLDFLADDGCGDDGFSCGGGVACVVDHGLFFSCSGVDCFGRTSWPVRNTPTSATTVTVAIVPPVFGWPLMMRYTPKLLKMTASMNAIHWLCLRAAYIVFRSSIRAVRACISIWCRCCKSISA